MRILVRTSKWAIWARRFGSLALPLAIVPVFLHRERFITSNDFHVIEIIAIAVAALAFLLALGAFGRLWTTGDQGWGKAVMGLLLSLICLLPPAYLGFEMLRYPAPTDITTDTVRPPGLVSQVEARPVADATEQAQVEAAFPNARSRTYPIEAAQMYALVVALSDARGWEPRARREPQTPLAEGQVNAVAMTLLGWRDEVAVRIQGQPQGSVVAMRSAALHVGPDFGENGRRIEDFMVALDERVKLILRDAPVTPGAEPEATEEEPAEEEPAEEQPAE
jgi:hypothetical protein